MNKIKYLPAPGGERQADISWNFPLIGEVRYRNDVLWKILQVEEESDHLHVTYDTLRILAEKVGTTDIDTIYDPGEERWSEVTPGRPAKILIIVWLEKV